MLIDRKQYTWVAVSIALGAGATLAYVADATRPGARPGGGTILGLTLGGAGLAIMCFCALLSVKRKVPHWRLGRAQVWLRAHVWLGLLLALLVALHSGFKIGGAMTGFLWIMTVVVVGSGIIGVAIQQVIPRLLLESLPGETVAQQIDHQIADAAAQARSVVVKYAGSVDAPAPPWTEAAAQTPVPTPPPITPAAPPPTSATGSLAAPKSAGDTKLATPAASPLPAAAKAATPSVAASGGKPPAGGEPLRRFYLDAAAPFMLRPAGSPLLNPSHARSMFIGLRRVCPPHIHPGVDDLEALCQRRRHLLAQRRWMAALHGWLILHVPLSYLYLIAVFAHAVIAVRYTR
ncbi:MAG: hypothetical protein JNM07_03190 [Phycisphaerae bacterium]|nr:hypothetical protein [Phycisphaerae bacterium]